MILIFTDELNPRIEYISKVIFSTILQQEISFTTNPSVFLQSDLPKLNYSGTRFDNEIYIQPHPIIYRKDLSKLRIHPVEYKNEKYFFESSPDSVFPFDPFSASFYLVTRYEEYFLSTRDQFNRYQANESLLAEYGLLKKPVVNIWAGMLAEKLKTHFPELNLPKPRFVFLPTIDIDNAWAYSHKGLWRSFGACTKDLLHQNISSIKNRILVWTGMKPDPYDTYAFIDEIYKDSVVKPVFFFLLGDYAPYDKNVSWKNKYLRNLIRRTAEKYPSGIHPSFAAGETNGGKKLQQEKKRLEIICGLKMTKSRQHFLRLHFPENYQNLLEAGIQEDYTMGYPSHTGFRAGICTPYHFYDLKKETETSLKIIPFQVMDVTLRNYMNLNPEEALNEIETLMREVKNVGGTFSCIWHNESLIGQDPWNGYREVFIQMNHKGFEWANGNA